MKLTRSIPLLSCALFTLVGCASESQDAPAPTEEPTGSGHSAQHAGPDPGSVVASIPAIPDNPPLEPEGPLSEGVVTVTDSVKSRGVDAIALIDMGGPTLLVADVHPVWVGWQVGSLSNVVTGGPQRVEFPVRGTLKLRLAENQWQAVREAKHLVSRPMKLGDADPVEPTDGGPASQPSQP